MYSGKREGNGVAGNVLDYPAQCPLGCAVAVWSMPEPEAERWECPAAARPWRACDRSGGARQ